MARMPTPASRFRVSSPWDTRALARMHTDPSNPPPRSSLRGTPPLRHSFQHPAVHLSESVERCPGPGLSIGKRVAAGGGVKTWAPDISIRRTGYPAQRPVGWRTPAIQTRFSRFRGTVRQGPIPTAGNADRAVPVDYRRFPALIQVICALSGWQGATRGQSKRPHPSPPWSPTIPETPCTTPSSSPQPLPPSCR